MSDGPNYCQHPECHNPHVCWYADHYGNRGSTDPRPWTPIGHFVTWVRPLDESVWRRWCKSHALLNEGLAFG